jgi:hypothetical protein
MDWKTISQLYVSFWFLTIPISITIFYYTTLELLDLIFNSGKINKLLKNSDLVSIHELKNQYEIEKGKQANLSKSLLMDLERQINYKSLKEKDISGIWTNRLKEEIVTAKRLSDIFKIK